MILGIKSDGELLETWIQTDDRHDNDGQPEWEGWPVGRQLSDRILSCIEEYLGWRKATLDDLTGIVVFRGPGSFTSLRIGIATANALAYALQIPIVGTTSEKPEDPKLLNEGWWQEGLELLKLQKSPQIIMPLYGQEPHITRPKKYKRPESKKRP